MRGFLQCGFQFFTVYVVGVGLYTRRVFDGLIVWKLLSFFKIFCG